MSPLNPGGPVGQRRQEWGVGQAAWEAGGCPNIPQKKPTWSLVLYVSVEEPSLAFCPLLVNSR